VAVSAGWNRSQNGNSLRLARLATLGFVLELLIVEKQLLSGRKDEIRAAIDALENLVLEFH
jgi:hypothetical protein